MKQERDIPLTNYKPLVQVFFVSPLFHNDYDLMGQGYLSILSEVQKDQVSQFIEVVGGRDFGVIIKSRILKSFTYEKQKQSVIAWADTQQRKQLAVSFESDHECDFFWRLICQIIGKNYLEITGEKLQMPNQHNLSYILQKTKSSKDLIEYHIINSKEFVNKLVETFNTIRNSHDKPALAKLDAIFNTMLNFADHKTIQALFRSPVYGLILKVKRCLKNIDYYKCWQESCKIKFLVSFPAEILDKVRLAHRVNFFRQKMINLMDDSYLETILVLTYSECCKSIIQYLTGDQTLQEVINIKDFTTQTTKPKPPKEKDDTLRVLSMDESLKIKSLSQASPKPKVVVIDSPPKIQQLDLSPKIQPLDSSQNIQSFDQSQSMQALDQSQKIQALDQSVNIIQAPKEPNVIVTILTDKIEPKEGQVDKQKFIIECKIGFLLESIVMAKQLQQQYIRNRYLDRLYNSGAVQFLTSFLDIKLEKSLSFFVALSQANPNKFMEYLRKKFRESPSNNLQIKLAKKFVSGNESNQKDIIDIIKYLGESFKVKENVDFFMGTFFAYIFQSCKDERGIICIIAQIQNALQNIEPLFNQALKCKLFDKLVNQLRNKKQTKIIELKTIKILKCILIENADSGWTFRKNFLNQINEQIISSGLFDYCISILSKNLRFNNIISSSMLENLKILSQIKRFTPYHKFIQQNYHDREDLKKYISKILILKEEKKQPSQSTLQPQSHEKELEQQRQEFYLLKELSSPDDLMVAQQKMNNEEMATQLENLRKLREELNEDERIKEERQMYQLEKTSKKLKIDDEADTGPGPTIEIELQFLEDIDQEKK